VTLNITIPTRDVYQSADFKLTDTSRRRLEYSRSNKTVRLEYHEWKGFITYTGVGRWHGRDVSQSLGSWLEKSSNPTPAEVAELVKGRADSLINAISVQQTRPCHTFVLGAFFADSIQTVGAPASRPCADEKGGAPAGLWRR